MTNAISEQFIERKIITGLIVSDDFIEHTARVYNNDCLQSRTAKIVANWCFEYYKKYGKSPKKDIEGIYYQKLQEDLDPERGSWIEDILNDLSDDYAQKEEEFDPDFLFDSAIKHFQKNQLNAMAERIKKAVDNGNLEAAFTEQQNFNPITEVELYEGESTDAGELYDMEIKEPKWLVNDLIPTGLTIFGGKSKVGKSYFMMNLVMALAQKKKMFGEDENSGFRGRSGEILFLSLEDRKKRFQNRMREIDPEPNLELLGKNLKPRFQWDKMKLGGLQKIEEWIERMEHPRLVIIDTFAKVWDKKTTTSGGNLYSEEYKLYGELSNLANRHLISVILITHTIKAKAKDVFDEILGGSGMAAPADNLIVLSNDLRGQKRLSIRGKDVEENHYAFTTLEGNGKFVYQGEAVEVQKTIQQQEIIDLFQEDQIMKYQEIKQALKEQESSISQNSINTLLGRMVKKGKLERPEYGHYCLAGSMSRTSDRRVAEKMKKRGSLHNIA